MTGNLTYTPASNAFGFADVTLKIMDNGGTANGGVNESPAQTFRITVNSVNDVPSFTKGADQTVLEDAAAQSVAGWATAISAGPANESGQALNFIVSNNNNALFSVQPAIAANGTLTYTPAANANGQATVTVQLHDDGGTANGGVDTSASQTFTITVTPVNDVPVANDSAATTNEDTAVGIDLGALVSDLETADANLTYVIDSGPSHGTLSPSSGPSRTYTPAADYFGSDSFTYHVVDRGDPDSCGAVGPLCAGAESSAIKTVSITVNAVNDAPSFTKGADQTVLEDAAAQSVAGWATAISAGPANESGQALNFIVSNNNNALFSVQPAIAANGTLTYTPAANANGQATVTVQLHDDGGTANGGVDTSASQTFTITVTPVNDVPVAYRRTFSTSEDTPLNINFGALVNDIETSDPNLIFNISGPLSPRVCWRAADLFERLLPLKISMVRSPSVTA